MIAACDLLDGFMLITGGEILATFAWAYFLGVRVRRRR